MTLTGVATTKVVAVDLRGGPVPVTGVAGGALVIDRATTLSRHASIYEDLLGARRVTGVVCLVVGGGRADAADAAILDVPPVLERDVAVLWAGDRRGINWAPKNGRVTPLDPDEPDALDQLIDALQVPEVFDRVHQTAERLPGVVASPGIAVASGGVEAVRMAEAKDAAVTALTTSSRKRAPGDDALVVATRAGLAAEEAQGQIRGSSRLGQAEKESAARLNDVDALARCLGTWRAIVGADVADRPDLSPRDLGWHVTQAGERAENYRLGLLTLLDGMDGHILEKDPHIDQVVELGVERPFEGRSTETATGLEEFVAARIRAGHSLPALAGELREAATLAAPQGVTSTLERVRNGRELGLDMPPFRTFPLALWTLVLAVIGGFVVGFAFGPGWAGWVAMVVYGLAWAGFGWLLLARRPMAHGAFGFPSAARVALPIYGAPPLLGGAGGVVTAEFVPGLLRPSPLQLQVATLVAVLVLLIAPVLCWRAAVRSWRRKLAAAELRATVQSLSTEVHGVIRREWLMVERRRAVAVALEAVAAALEEVARELPVLTRGLFASGHTPVETPRQGALASAAYEELMAVVGGDLAAVAFDALEQVWPYAAAGGRAPAGVHRDRLRALLKKYADHVEDQGLLTPLTTSTEPPDRRTPTPRELLAARQWKQSDPARVALALAADDSMMQLCDDAQIDYLSTTTAPGLVRFAPNQVRLALERTGLYAALLDDSGVVWSRGHELIGSLRLVPVRLESVSIDAGEQA